MHAKVEDKCVNFSLIVLLSESFSFFFYSPIVSTFLCCFNVHYI